MLYDLETITKTHHVLDDKVTLENCRRMSRDGLKPFELTRSFKMKAIWDIKKTGFAGVTVIFDSAKNADSFVHNFKVKTLVLNPFHKTLSTDSRLLKESSSFSWRMEA